MRYFLCVLGMVMIVEGLPYFAFPRKMKTWMQMLVTMPEHVLWRLGIVAMLIGLSVVYLARRG